MIYTVGDALKRIAPFVDGAGVQICDDATRQQALTVYNRIVSRLMKEGGHAAGVVKDVCLPIDDCCLTLDSSILSIRNVRAFNGPGDAVQIRSQGYKYLDSGPGQIGNCCGPCLTAMEPLGDQFVTHRDLNKPMHLVAWSDRPEDADAKIKFHGFDVDKRQVNQWVPLQVGDPDTAPAFTGGDGFSPGVYADINYIAKPRTCGYVTVWGWIPECQELQWLTTIRPEETAPCHRRYKLNGVPPSCTVKASVTLRFVPAQHETQVALIQDMDALEAMAIALSQHDSASSDGFQLYQAYRNSGVSQMKKARREENAGQRHGLNVRVAGAPGKIPSGSMR